MAQILASTWSFSQRANEVAWPILLGPDPGTNGGRALAAAEAACCHADLDSTIDSVGYGGLPDAEGRMSLDGAVMLGPRRFGGVCGLRRHIHTTTIGRLVMERTEHGLLCGEDADRFASRHGVKETELLAPEAEASWREWQARPHRRDDSRDGAARIRPLDQGPGTGRLFSHDTIGVLALDAEGTLAAACSTSGLAYKVPGRVGDSPIVGHGLYVEPQLGAATVTGTGELISGVCASFLAVETLRQGGTPRDAVGAVLQRVDELEDLEEHHQVGLIVLAADGSVACGALRPGFRAAIRDDDGSRIVESDLVSRPDGAELPESAREGLSQGDES